MKCPGGNIFCSLLFSIFILLPGQLKADPGQGELHFAITSAVASDPSYANYRKLTNYISNKLGRKSAFISGLSYNQVDNLFVSNKVDVGFLCNAHYARQRDVEKFVPIAAPVITGYKKAKFRIYVIVPKESRLKTLDDLRGRSVDLADPLSTTTIFTAYMLKNRNADMKSFFRKVYYSGNHDMTIQLVASGLVDSGVVDGHIWDYHEAVEPKYSSKTKVIFRSQEFTIPPVVVGRSVDPGLKKRIRDILLSMHEETEGRKILASLRVERFVDIKESDYEDVSRMYKLVKKLL